MSTITDAETAAQERPAAYSGRAGIGFACAVVAVLTPAPFSLLAAVFAVSAAILSRKQLREDAALRGTGLSLAAFLVGATVLLFGIIPAVPGVLAFLPRF